MNDKSDWERSQLFEDVFFCKSRKFGDTRGLFSELPKPISLPIQHSFYSINHSNVIRGMHYQNNLAPQDKIVSCIAGKIKDVIVDLRVGSNTFLKVFDIALGVDCYFDSIYVPHGFGHGFQSLSSNSIVLYQTTNFFSPESYKGISPKDSLVADLWVDVENALISDKDRSLPKLKDLDMKKLY